MAKTQPKIDDIKDLKKATDVSDGLMSKEDKIKLDSLDSELIDNNITGYELGHENNLFALGIGIYILTTLNTYFNTPNILCGTDASSNAMKGILTIKENKNNIRTLIYHDAINNNLYICSANYVVTSWVYSTWKRLLTCLDTTDVIEQEGEEYVFTIESNNTEIYIPSGEGVFDSKNDTIIIDVSNLIIGGRCHFWIYFSVPITGAININIETNDSNPITYGSFYVDPYMIPSSQIVSGIEYIVWRYPTSWHIVNRIF